MSIFKREKKWAGRRFEYKTIQLNGAHTGPLNKAGERGWELVAVRPTMGLLSYAMMKREIPDGEDPSGEPDE